MPNSGIAAGTIYLRLGELRPDVKSVTVLLNKLLNLLILLADSQSFLAHRIRWAALVLLVAIELTAAEPTK